ncbi:CAP domain-containing protein [Enterococcus cecorum]
MPETTDEPQSDDNIKNPSAIEQDIFKIINEEREKRGLMPLEWSEEVYEAAKARAVEATNSDEERLKKHLRLDGREASSILRI